MPQLSQRATGAAAIDAGDGPALIFDIGGGSTELVLVDSHCDGAPRIVDWVSAPWGVVSLTESAGGGDGDGAVGLASAYERMCNLVRESFAPFAARLPKVEGPRRLLGTSGTVTTLASVHLELDRYDRAQVDGLIAPAASMRAMISSSGTCSAAELTRACVS